MNIVRETYGMSDYLEFARTIKEFEVSFVYNSIEGGSYGITESRIVRFRQREMFVDKQDQWVLWPMWYSFAYVGTLDEFVSPLSRTRVIDIECTSNRQDPTAEEIEFSARTGYTTDIMWD